MSKSKPKNDQTPIKPFDTAKGIRTMEEAMKKAGGKTYHNAVELQKARERHKNYMKSALVVVVDNKELDKPNSVV